MNPALIVRIVLFCSLIGCPRAIAAQTSEPSAREVVRWLNDSSHHFMRTLLLKRKNKMYTVSVRKLFYSDGTFGVRFEAADLDESSNPSSHTALIDLASINRPVAYECGDKPEFGISDSKGIPLRSTRADGISEDGRATDYFIFPCGDKEWGDRCAKALNRLLDLHPLKTNDLY